MTTYRRRQGNSWPREEEGNSQNRLRSYPNNLDSDAENSSSLAAKAIRASSAYRDSSLSSAYSEAILSPTSSSFPSSSPSPLPKVPAPHESTFPKISNVSKPGFWGALAKKAKAILEDDNMAPELEQPESNRHLHDTKLRDKNWNQYHSAKHRQETEGPALQKGLGALATSLNSIGGAIGNALEEGLTVVENRTADIIQETRKLQIRRKAENSELQKQPRNIDTRQQHIAPQIQKQSIQNAQDIQLKASRDVAMAMAAKAKLLLRELKTVKADLAFAKERCAQLEEENRMLRQNHGKGDSLEDDDLIRLQLETLLAEKARLAQENLVYARENRFLKEVVEYHQLTMQDVVYLDEGKEEVTEVYPVKQLPTTTRQQGFLIPPRDSSISNEVLQSITSQVTQGVSASFMPSEKIIHVSYTGGESKLR